MVPRSLRFPISFFALAAAFIVFTPATTQAKYISGQPAPWWEQRTDAGVSFSLDAAVGVAEGTATELAFDYPNGRKFKLSELTWDIKDVVMANVRGSLSLSRRFRLNLGFWSALTAGNGMMVDRDWIYPESRTSFLEPTDSNWTDESRHPDTGLDKGTILDLNLSVLALQAGPFSLRGIVGYKNDTWSWSARGGTYIYSTWYYGSRDFTGAFPADQEVITYEQQYSIPYIGVGASWTKNAFQVESHLYFSTLVSASDSDYHVLRGVFFEADFSKGTYVGFGLNASWAFTQHWAATLGLEYQHISEITGDVTITGEEGDGFYSDGGGLALNAALVTLGAGYRF